MSGENVGAGATSLWSVRLYPLTEDSARLGLNHGSFGQTVNSGKTVINGVPNTDIWCQTVLEIRNPETRSPEAYMSNLSEKRCIPDLDADG